MVYEWFECKSKNLRIFDVTNIDVCLVVSHHHLSHHFLGIR